MNKKEQEEPFRQKRKKELKQGDYSVFFRKKKDKNKKSIAEKQSRRKNGPVPSENHDKKIKKVRKYSKTNYTRGVDDGLIRLNKYIADAGICSRREADKLIEAGVIRVNGEVVTQLGYKVSRGDKVQYDNQTLNAEKLRYILLNKPKGYLTTMDDPFERKTVMQLVKTACRERIYPVGRLDRNTTGLLLLTNDGEMAKRLTHPSHNVEKLYHVTLDQPLSKRDLQAIAEGIELDDGFIRVDGIGYDELANDRKEVGVKIHSGKNRIVRRIFESLGYKVEKLDRVIFAGLTKKDLPRGRWRHLTDKEISFLKIR